MIHHFDCDNCGKTVETWCFNDEDPIVTYYTPPVQYPKIMKTEEEVVALLENMARSAMTTLCAECINQ